MDATPLPGDLRVAVLIPCYNEAATIASVVRDFRAALPGAAIHVCDNNSTDGTAAAARAAGAAVRRQALQGKGHAVRRMFADVDADVYVLVDGDATYDAPSAPAMVRLLLEEDLDMVNARRVETCRATYRQGHRWGNAAFTGMVAALFGDRIGDLLSGYRAFSRRFVKSFPVASDGFEIETEMTVHALELGLPVGEIDTPYYARPEGSVSKLSTWRDGFRILRMVGKLLVELRPVQVFGAAALACLLAALALGAAPGLSVGLAAPTAFAGAVLGGVARGRREAKQLAYLAQHAAPIEGRSAEAAQPSGRQGLRLIPPTHPGLPRPPSPSSAARAASA